MTGWHGGPFKRFVLNDALIERMGAVAGRAILELGAGNGYFLPLALRRFSGQAPAHLVVSDNSRALLRIAERHFRLPGAEYRPLDLRDPLPFSDASFDLILATMVFNELTTPDLRRTLAECRRVLRPAGRLLATVTHPDFVASLAKRGVLRPAGPELALLPGAEGMPLPVARRSAPSYIALLEIAGFAVEQTDVHATAEMLRAKPGLRNAAGIPLALVLTCTQPPRA